MVECRRGARTGTAVRLPETGRVAVRPHRLTGGQAVAGDDLVGAALLLRVHEAAADREGRPPRSDRPAPQRDRRRCGPVGLDTHTGDDVVAMRSAKAGPFGGGFRRSRPHWLRRIYGFGCDLLLRGLGCGLSRQWKLLGHAD